MLTYKTLPTIVACALACLLSTSAMAQWQWIANDGSKVFSDQPPGNDIPEKNILKRPRGFSSSGELASTYAEDEFKFDDKDRRVKALKAMESDTELQAELDRAQKGDVKAMYRVGVTYGLAYRNWKRAEPWIRKAAMQGDAQAQSFLGYMYALGEGVEQDAKQAGEWFRKAAEQGYSDTQEPTSRRKRYR